MSAMPTEQPETARAEKDTAPAAQPPAEKKEEPPAPPQFILYKEGPAYADALRQLTLWTHHVLLPVYGREISSTAPWCPRWWEHPEAVAQLHGLWLAWADLTGPGSVMTGPASWHRDYLLPVMNSLRDPQGPFAGCKPGMHRAKEKPPIDIIDPFGPPPPSSPR
ncbi:hypothetical protein GCM10018772_05530 [Streptomyces fumanus]|uniref:DUF4913 domain-containing protein n=2 Tax=Streptomyces fumanus TaxID=67302 RepID=A0A919A3G7_9ACTN|nr:DUF4913 domain-containing protein [Streptomyces fumanus]GHE85221.1 hypothetical protein GCM10018772_05530 [Streptomyces fumanus]